MICLHCVNGQHENGPHNLSFKELDERLEDRRVVACSCDCARNCRFGVCGLCDRPECVKARVERLTPEKMIRDGATLFALGVVNGAMQVGRALLDRLDQNIQRNSEDR